MTRIPVKYIHAATVVLAATAVIISTSTAMIDGSVFAIIAMTGGWVALALVAGIYRLKATAAALFLIAGLSLASATVFPDAANHFLIGA